MVKSHKQAPMGWEQALCQGVKSALFIQAPGTGTAATAFQMPMLNADNIPAPRLQELLLIRKPVALWGGMFALLEAEPSTKDEEEINNPYNGGMLFEQDEFKAP
ncbi:hypothetical protein ACA910_021881 [Epithemia clementina (nom. ined.)]